MLRQMRERTKTILWIVVLTFIISIFALWGMDLRSNSGRRLGNSSGPQIVGSVDGIDIPARQYSVKIQEIMANVRAQRGQNYEMSAAEEYMVREQAWERTIEDVLINREIQKLGITVTDDELVAYLRRNPHPQLRKMFTKDDGSFDYQAYLQALSDPKNDWTELEKWGRAQLPTAKLTTYLLSQIHIPDRDIMEKYNDENVEMTAEYVEVPFGKPDTTYTPSEDELRALYDQNKDDYVQLEKRGVDLIQISMAPTELDDKEVYDELMDIKKEILDGTDFDEAAKNYSEDYMTASKGGDLGFFSRDMMDSTFTAAAFALKKGEISDPVRTDYGYHLIKLNDRKVEDGVEKVSASHILLKVEPGYETMDSLSTFITDLKDNIEKEGFKKAAKQAGLEVIPVEPFTKGSFIKGFGYVPQVINFAFNNKPGSVSDQIRTDDNTFFVKVTNIIPEKTKSFEDVRSILVEKARRDKGIEKAKDVADAIRQKAVTGGDLAAASHEHGLQMKKTDPFKFADNIPGIGSGTAFAYACKLLPVNTVSEPIKDSSEWYVIRVVSKTAPDLKDFAKSRDDIRNEILQERSQEFLGKWYQQLRDNAKVVDKRQTTLK